MNQNKLLLIYLGMASYYTVYRRLQLVLSLLMPF